MTDVRVSDLLAAHYARRLAPATAALDPRSGDTVSLELRSMEGHCCHVQVWIQYPSRLGLHGTTVGCQFVHFCLSICLSVCVWLSVCLPVFLSVCLCLSICLSESVAQIVCLVLHSMVCCCSSFSSSAVTLAR